jgi:hypothetical protein
MLQKYGEITSKPFLNMKISEDSRFIAIQDIMCLIKVYEIDKPF